MIPITIDGQNIEVPPGTTVLKAAELAGIKIPTLCNFPALKPYGACRLCVVEIEGARTLQSSCTLPVYKGMVVRTNTPRVRQAREFVLTLIFSERNHFCMYCQKTNGDCELQNRAYFLEMTHWPIQPNWDPQNVDASSSYFVIDHNRCILCRRCVRACSELVGNFTLSVENRGGKSHIIADSGSPIGNSSCINCGTCVQVCPTGTFIDRRSVYFGKDVSAKHVKSICLGCSVGCGLDVLVKENKIMRVDGDWNAPVNQGVICELGRYGEINVNNPRIKSPMIKINGKLQETSWDEALSVIVTKLKIANKKGEISALASSRLPSEALYLLKSIFSNIPASMITSTDVYDQKINIPNNYNPILKSPHSYGDLDNLKEADCVLILGADLGISHQVIGFFIKRNRPLGNCIISVDTNENSIDAFAHYVLRIKNGTEKKLIDGLIAAINNLGLNKSTLPVVSSPKLINEISKSCGIPSELLISAAREMACAQKPVIIYGAKILKEQPEEILQSLHELASITKCSAMINIVGKANSNSTISLDLQKEINFSKLQAIYVALGDDFISLDLLRKIEKIPFIAVQASYISEITEKADVVLPVEAWFEQEGYFVNLDHRLQKTKRATEPDDLVFSNVAVLKRLASELGIKIPEDWQKSLNVIEN